MNVTYLVQAEETQVTDDRESADAWPCGDFSCHLQSDLHNLQRVCEDHLRSPSLKINKTSIQVFTELHEQSFL